VLDATPCEGRRWLAVDWFRHQIKLNDFMQLFRDDDGADIFCRCYEVKIIEASWT